MKIKCTQFIIQKFFAIKRNNKILMVKTLVIKIINNIIDIQMKSTGIYS